MRRREGALKAVKTHQRMDDVSDQCTQLMSKYGGLFCFVLLTV